MATETAKPNSKVRVQPNVINGLTRVIDQIAIQDAAKSLAIPYAEARRKLLNRLTEQIVEKTSIDVVFNVKLDIVDSDKTEVDVLCTRHEEIPGNIRKWAGRVGIRSCISNRSIEENTRLVDGGNSALLIASPFDDEKDQLESIVSLSTKLSDAESLRQIHLSVFSAIKQWKIARELCVQHQQTRDLASITELISRIETSGSPEAACQKFADELEEHLSLLNSQAGDDPEQLQVFVSLADKDDEIKLSAISSSNSAPTRGETTELCEAAMRECLSRRKMSSWPATEDDRQALLCHEQFANRINRNSVVSLPLHSADGKLQGVTLVAADELLSDRVRNFLGASGTSIATSLSLINKTKKSKFVLILEKTLEQFRGNRAASIFKIAAILTAIGLIPMPYRVSTECEIQPLEKRFVAAPFAGQLKECLVEPGDTVNKDQVLALMDEREIRIELAEVEANLHHAMKTRDGHVAAHESGEARLASLEAERLTARRDLLLHRSNNLELKSPVDGVVIAGELKRAQGMPLEIGRSLFEVAPLNSLIAEVAIPEDDIRYVEPGMKTKMRINSLPFESWHGTIETVHPAAEILNDDNVFVAKVNLANDSGKLKPGMRGHAKVSTIWRPIAWNYLHKPVANVLRWGGW